MGRPKKDKPTLKPTPKGQSANPAGNEKMRRIQAVLNARYADEWYAVDVLDKARQTKDSEGELYSDRHIIVEALKALGEKYPDSFSLPPISHEEKIVPPHIITHIVDAVLRSVDMALEGIGLNSAGFNSSQWREQRQTIREDVVINVSGVVSTGNLTGDSYKFDDTDDIDDWSN